MATLPNWKLQLPARRRQEKTVVQGREQDERDQVAQQLIQEQGLLERFHAKAGVPMAEPGLGNEAIGDAPPEPDKSVVILEAIRPVHWDHFTCQMWKKQLTDRRLPEGQGHISREEEAQEQRPNPAKAQEQSLVKRESREQKPSLGEAGERRLGGTEVGEQSLGPTKVLEWRLSPKEMKERSPELSESWQWEKSSGEAQERNEKPVEPQEQTSGEYEMGECRLGLQEESKKSSEESKTEQRLMQRKCRENSGLLETQRCRLKPRKFREPSSGAKEVAEIRLNPGEDQEKSSRQIKGQKWRLDSGKTLEPSPGRSGVQEQKPVSSGSGDKKLGMSGVEVGEGRTKAAEEEVGNGGKMVSSVTKLLPPKEVVTRNPGPQYHLPPTVYPLPSALPTLKPSRLIHLMLRGIKFEWRVKAPGHSGYSRQSRPPTASAPPEPQISGPGKKQVLGGYLHPSRSCLAKRSPERRHKQRKVSFNESALETTYYYPSENSVLQELGLYS